MRVLDLGDRESAYCTKLLADLGAIVTKVEPRQGSAMRWAPPFKGDQADPEANIAFSYYQANKRGITLDLWHPEAQGLLRSLIAESDVVVSSLRPSVGDPLGLNEESISAIDPTITFCSITPFGRTGPYRNFRATHLTTYAMGGPMYGMGEAEGPPLAIPGQQAFDLAGIYAAFAVLAADRGRTELGGQAIDISIQEVLASGAHLIHRYAIAAAVQVREGKRPTIPPGGRWTCLDGEVEFQVMAERHWQGFLRLLGSPEEFSSPEWASMLYRSEHRESLHRATRSFTASLTVIPSRARADSSSRSTIRRSAMWRYPERPIASLSRSGSCERLLPV
jgi:crotonobetainyl-CoA:carnitine CoA-transferase CaiB-like acyl-CoA transferase